MQYKKLGRTGLRVSEICLGTMTFGAQVADGVVAVKLIEQAMDAGVNFIDTADNVYAEGRSEEIVGRALQGKRQSVVLATKVAFPTGDGVNDFGLSRKHIMEGVEASLRRLQTDYIDLYYAHKPDYDTPIEVTLRAMDDLVRQGKVRYIAYSNCRAWQICKALWVSEVNHLARFECVQTPYNLITRENEYELLSFCEDEGLGVCTYNPLAGGLLTGKHDPDKPPVAGTRFAIKGEGPEYSERYWTAANFEALAQFKKTAGESGRSLPQFALAWTLSNKAVTSVIIGVTSQKQLEENLGAADAKLSAAELAACDEAWHRIRPPRYVYGR